MITVVSVIGSLRVPVTSNLSQVVETLVRRGDRRVLLDLTELRDIDAAGIGELVRAFNFMTAAGGLLQIANPKKGVRRVLEITGLFAVLAGATLSPANVEGDALRHAEMLGTVAAE